MKQEEKDKLLEALIADMTMDEIISDMIELRQVEKEYRHRYSDNKGVLYQSVEDDKFLFYFKQVETAGNFIFQFEEAEKNQPNPYMLTIYDTKTMTCNPASLMQEPKIVFQERFMEDRVMKEMETREGRNRLMHDFSCVLKKHYTK